MKKFIEKFLRILAKAIIRKYHPEVVGITGSVGKTSAKDAVKSVLEGSYNIRATAKNFNNEIGVPLTIIGADSPGKSIFGWIGVFLKAIKLILKKNKKYPEILVLEMGADKEGDIGYLVDIAPCNVGVITNVSESHLEFFGSVNKVKIEKRKIIEHLKPENYAILNCDIDNVCEMRNVTKAKTITYGFDQNTDVSASDVAVSYDKEGWPNGLNFKLVFNGSVIPIFIPKIVGYSHIYSVLVAVAVGSIYKISLMDMAKAFDSFYPPKGRMRLIKGIKHTLIIDDTYNSLPASARLAVEVMQEIKVKDNAKKIVVFGDMLELGKFSEEKHKELGEKIAESHIDILITKGEASKNTAKAAISAGMSKDKVYSFTDNDEAGKFVQKIMSKGDIILVKGSQGMRMETIVKEIMAEPLRASELLVRQGKEWANK